MTQGEYERMVEFIRPATEGWKTHAYKCSALTHDGLPELWAVMRKFEKETKESGVFQNRRKSQLLSWVRGMIDEHLHNLFFNDPMIKGRIPLVEHSVVNGLISPSQAVTAIWTGRPSSICRATSCKGSSVSGKRTRFECGAADNRMPGLY